jgi:AAA+ superfamily predicted ATPase
MDSHFKFKSKTRFCDIKKGTTIPESDLCFQDDTYVYQFEYVDENKDKEKIIIEPGVFSMTAKSTGAVPKEIEIREQNILTSIVNTQSITTEANAFFGNLDIYEELGEEKARKLLIYSDPGMGKTSSITDYCNQSIQSDKGTVILIWPTSSVDSDDMLDFLTKKSKYDDKCSRMILVMEDIGGGEREGSSGARAVDSAMLDILDGIGVSFKVPTLIIATTNYPQNLLSALADRPGRFDKMIKLEPPTKEERVAIVEFISKRRLDKDEYDAVVSNDARDFSIAHWKEVVIRSLLHRKSLKESIKELIEHKKKFNQAFDDNKRSTGFMS